MLKLKILNIAKRIAFKKKLKKEDYTKQKMMLNHLIISGGSQFDMKWFKKNQFLIRHVFTKKDGLEIFQYNNAANTNYKGPLESIVYEDETLKIKGKNFTIDFFKPSHGTIEINHDVGDSYEMHFYSAEKIPSQLKLSYYNI